MNYNVYFLMICINKLILNLSMGPTDPRACCWVKIDKSAAAYPRALDQAVFQLFIVVYFYQHIAILTS